jgi:hypothetical protein
MKLDCFPSDEVELDIRPNAHGWVICCGSGFEAEWNGGQAPEDVLVFPVTEGTKTAYAHFGYGILTLAPKAMFRTEPGYNLWISGPPNTFKDGIQALSAVVETDWMPYTFTMNWKFTRPEHRVRFEKGEPYCFLFPVERGLLESMEPQLKDPLPDGTGSFEGPDGTGPFEERQTGLSLRSFEDLRGSGE